MTATLLDLDALVRTINDLEPLPQSAARLASLLLESDSSPREIEEVVSKDQALTARLLRAANSAASASIREIVTPDDALMRLGRAKTLLLSMASGVQKRMTGAIPQYDLPEGELWRHSVAAATAAELIPGCCGIEIPPATYSAALLHDIGKLVLGRFLSKEIMELLRRAREEGGLSEFDSESEVLQVHHAEVGGLLARHWGLPDSIVEGINYHHRPSDGSDRVCYTTYLANVAANSISDSDEQRVRPSDFESTIAELDVSLEGFEKLSVATGEKFRQVQSLYE